jgi:hypothetical protein
MTSRFGSNIVTLLAGAVLVALTLGLATTAAGWVALGSGCLVAVVTLIAFAVRGRGHGQRAIDVVLIAVATWTIVSSRTFDGAPLKWLTIANGCAMAAFALTGLIAHEVRLERSIRRTSRGATDGKVSRLPERPPASIAN